MIKRDYSDEDDYYTQDFAHEGLVSIWIELAKPEVELDVDALQEYCGVGYYSLDNQESNQIGEVVSLKRLLADISFSASFSSAAIEAARSIGVTSAYWVLVQFDFAYDPSKVKRTPTTDLVFIGVFPYQSGLA